MMLIIIYYIYRTLNQLELYLCLVALPQKVCSNINASFAGLLSPSGRPGNEASSDVYEYICVLGRGAHPLQTHTLLYLHHLFHLYFTSSLNLPPSLPLFTVKLSPSLLLDTLQKHQFVLKCLTAEGTLPISYYIIHSIYMCVCVCV